MGGFNMPRSRDIEKAYPRKQFIEKLRRLADSLEHNLSFRIQIAGERIRIPADALINIEHERQKGRHEIEFQLKWSDTD
jgi:amphi-Trp domain-containing protein